MEVCVALRHVYNKLDTNNQWKRAVDALRSMTELEKAQAWKSFSADNLKLESSSALIVHSQYKALFKAAIREAAKNEFFLDMPLHCDTNDAAELLKDYRTRLDEFAELLAGFNYFYRKDSPDHATDTVTDPGHSAQTVSYYAHTGDQISLSNTLSELQKNGKEQKEKMSELLEIIRTEKRPQSPLQSTALSRLESAIGDVQARLLQHETSLNEITGSMDRLKELAKSIPDETTRKQEQLDLTSSIEEMTGILSQQHAEQEARYREFQRQTVEVHTQHEDLLALNVEFQKELGRTQFHFLEKLESLSSNITTVAQTITDISTRSSEMNAAVRVDLESLHRQYDTMQSDMQLKFNGLHSTDAVEEHAKKITELEKSVLEAQKQVSTLNTHTQQEITIVKTRANEIITHIKNLESRQRFPPATPDLKLFPGGSTVDESSYPGVAATVQKTNNPNA
jgi:hypothetical protein